jgi:hypothetical protein
LLLVVVVVRLRLLLLLLLFHVVVASSVGCLRLEVFGDHVFSCCRVYMCFESATPVMIMVEGYGGVGEAMRMALRCCFSCRATSRATGLLSRP